MPKNNYYLASGLKGFPSSTLRVKLVEMKPGLAIVRTASLLDAGTLLCLDPSQLEPETDEREVGVRHKDGFIIFTGGPQL